MADNVDMTLGLGGMAPQAWGYGACVRVRPEDLPRARAWLDTYDERQKLRDRGQSGAPGVADDLDEEAE